MKTKTKKIIMFAIICIMLGIFLGWFFTNPEIWLKNSEMKEPLYLKDISKNNLDIKYYNLECINEYNFVIKTVEFFRDFCTKGLYNPISNQILIALKNPKDEVKQSLFHEIGHSLWRSRLTPKDKINYEKLYFKSKITEYANDTSANEDFSELYAFMMLDFKDMDFDLSSYHKVLERDYNKEKLIERILRENRDYDLRNVTPSE